MKFKPFYFFCALFISFMIIYLFKNDYYVITKDKNKSCTGNACLVKN